VGGRMGTAGQRNSELGDGDGGGFLSGDTARANSCKIDPSSVLLLLCNNIWWEDWPPSLWDTLPRGSGLVALLRLHQRH
jgi:hypothetical protein